MTHAEKLSLLREQTDGLMKIADLMKGSRYVSSCRNDLEMAKFWMGQVKGAIPGNPSPYVIPDEDKDNPEKIPATSDVFTGEVSVSDNHLKNVNVLRENIDIVLSNFNNELRYQDPLTLQEDKKFMMVQVQVYLLQAKGRLGYELATIRENHLKEKK